MKIEFMKDASVVVDIKSYDHKREQFHATVDDREITVDPFVTKLSNPNEVPAWNGRMKFIGFFVENTGEPLICFLPLEVRSLAVATNN